MNSPAEYNPFSPPKEIATSDVESPLQRWQSMVDQFRREMHALAGVAIFFASISLMVTTVGLTWQNKTGATEIVAGFIGGVISIGFFVLGIQIAMKKMLAVRLFMSLAYIMLVLAMLSIPRTTCFGIFCAVCLGFTVAQSHGVLSNARNMVAAGIPLHKKPSELFAERLRGSWDPPERQEQNIPDSQRY